MRKPVVRKTPLRRKSTSKKKSSFWTGTRGSFVLGILFTLFLFGVAYHYRNGLGYYFSFKSDKIANNKEDKRLSDVRNFQLLIKYEDKVAGLDVSQYQGTINWSSVRVLENTFPIGFVFIRATVGKDKVDSQFNNNWLAAKNS